MRAVIQRVQRASVNVEGKNIAQIDKGLLVFLGVGCEDTETDCEYMAEKIAFLRVFPDAQGKMNLNVQQVGGAVLAVSQFTLYGDARRGRRPSFSDAAPSEEANGLYGVFVDILRSKGVQVRTGVFQAHMEVELLNDGPVTILLSSGGEF